MCKLLYKRKAKGGRPWRELLKVKHDVFGGMTLLEFGKKEGWKCAYGTLRRMYGC